MAANYYYVSGSRQKGPVSELELDTLVVNERLTPETLVWCDGMESWKPYSAVRGPVNSFYGPAGFIGAVAPARYAYFGDRVLAKALDFGIVVIFAAALQMIEKLAGSSPVFDFLRNSFGFFYVLSMHALRGQTVGKIVLKIKVVQPSGADITVGQAVARSLAEILSGCLFGLGYITALFDPHNRALHDQVARTRVIRLSAE